MELSSTAKKVLWALRIEVASMVLLLIAGFVVGHSIFFWLAGFILLLYMVTVLLLFMARISDYFQDSSDN
ncbi:MAG: hypothetical protein H0T73_22400 [Ardenticatenales bacterium]|nr:hypothetical protein [Ardenticatenales bacterium]